MNSVKKYRNIGGIDLRSPELLRDDATATTSLNSSLSENLSLSKRKGYQYIGEGKGGLGVTTYKNTDIATGIEDVERLVFDSDVWRHLKGTVKLKYTGPFSPNVEIKVNEDTGEFNMYLWVDGDIVQTINLGTSLTDNDFSINTALSNISAPFSFEVYDKDDVLVPSLGDSVNSAYLQVIENTGFDSEINIGFRYYTKVDSPIPSPFQAAFDKINDDNFELLSIVQKSDVMYITGDSIGLWKYDGETLHKAGLPKPFAPQELANESGSDTYIYRIVLKSTDHKDNVIYSTPSDEYVSENGRITIDFGDLTTLLGGFRFNGALTEVLILRSKANLGTLYVADTIGYNVATGPLDYVDTIDDVDLTEDYALPVVEQNLLPNCRYIDVFRDQLVLTGDPNAVHTVYFADLEYPEGFSILNSFQTSTRRGGPNSGIKSKDNFLFVFKAGSVTAVTGALETGQFQVDTLSDEGIGCLSHHSLVEAGGNIWFVSRQGIYTLTSESLNPASQQLDPIFRINLPKIETNRIIGHHLIDDKRVIFMLPEAQGTTEKYFKAESQILSFNIYTGKWDIWNNIDFSSGIATDNRDVYFISTLRRTDGVITRNVGEILNTNTELDYADHNLPIYFEREFDWESLGEPSVYKKIHRLKLFSIDSPLNAFVTPDFTLDIETHHDYVDSAVSVISIKFLDGEIGWGSGKWGLFPWGNPRPTQRRVRLNTRKCLSLRLKISNNKLYENILISGVEYEANPMYSLLMRDK